MVFHHVVELKKMLQKFNSILNRGGYLCIADLDKEDGNFHKGMEYENLHHGFERNALESLLEETGFNPVFYKIILDIDRISENGEVKKYPVFLMIAMKN
jgi:hypothetical protein